MLSLTAQGRYQWTGVDGAPRTHAISGHMPVKHKKIGVGLLLTNDQIGITSQNGAFASFSFRLPVTNDITLAMGLQGSATSYKVSFSKSNLINSSDPVYNQGDIAEIMPNFGAGFFLSAPRFYLGFSAMNMIENSIESSQSLDALQQRQYFLNGGLIIDLTPGLKLKPNFLLTAIEGIPMKADINANLLIEEVLWIGASYRSLEALSSILEVQMNSRCRLGYSYDFSSSELDALRAGSHEIMLNYRLVFTNQKVITPRYY